MATRRTSDSTRSSRRSSKTSSTEAAPAPREPTSSDVSAPTGGSSAEAQSAGARAVRRSGKPEAPAGEAPLSASAQVSEETRRSMIAQSAYLRAERRGFAPGHELEDWCAAEKEVDALLNARPGTSPQ